MINQLNHHQSIMSFQLPPNGVTKLEKLGQEEELERETPLRYVPLCHVYSATSPCGSSNVMSKKVKARKLLLLDDESDSDYNRTPLSGMQFARPPLIHFYSRRKRNRRNQLLSPPVHDTLVSKPSTVVPSIVVKVEEQEEEKDEVRMLTKEKKRRKTGCAELNNLEVDSTFTVDGPLLRESRNRAKINARISNESRRRRRNRDAVENDDQNQAANPKSCGRSKRWVRLSFSGVDPKKFVGLQCKVYWPLDADWYCGCVVGYDSESDRHHIEYEDGDEENVILSNERIKFFISPEEVRSLVLSYSRHCSDMDDLDVNEMVVLAASLDDCHEIEPGDVIWAKVTGHAVWPAIVLEESLVSIRKGLARSMGEKSVLVQFFGTHDFARVKIMQVIPFLKGLLSSYHLKCKKSDFSSSLEEAKMYLSKQKLPKRMLRMRISVLSLGNCPFSVGDLKVLSLGRLVKDSDHFQDERFIWPLGYKAVRKFLSVTEPSVYTLYKMEVLRDADLKARPLFRVTTDSGEQFEGSNPSACWNKIYRRIRNMKSGSDGLKDESTSASIFQSGPDMFGFSHPDVLKLIQESSDLKVPTKRLKLGSERYEGMPSGYRPVRVKWKDLDKCSVCHMDEEYENNLFLQCDKCRMMVHTRCYGELEPADGVLWLCNLCRPGAPEISPPCCLCPVLGGAMKPTTDGRWAHLACAMWIPETCLSDIKKMEPIDGLSRISKDRWKLLCSICGVSYGACIQCSKNTCYAAYHPLCARAAGFCAELADQDRLHQIPVEEDEDNQCIRLLSFCKKHTPPSLNERAVADERVCLKPCQYSDYNPPLNPSGCARSEAYSFSGRRGRKEPEALAAASMKRSFVENRPYLVGGFCQHVSLGTEDGPKFSGLEKLKASQLDASSSVISMKEKYKYMRKTFRKRLAFGKSGIHGFGIFAKQPHSAGDMVIEYTGELVRPSIADRREHLIYNSLVGAGTYMFRIDDERVIDATRAGSIAHLINHSCEPNCYSRVISVNGDEHIIIFAKRDIKHWEELTYDYRFFSIDEQLACYCGFSKCRGVVNDVEAEDQVAKLYVPRNELTHWTGE